MVTIDDVAREAGVSKSTVSRVILGEDKVKPRTQQAVQSAIKRLNYVPNSAARSLASKSTGNIAVISSYTFNDPFFSVVAEEIYTTLLRHGYSTLFFTYRLGSEKSKEPSNIFNGMADGFIYMGDHSVSEDQLSKAARMGLVTALFKTGIRDECSIQADVDNIQGALDGTEYLIRQGHQRIALVCGFDGYYETNDRIRGYQIALHEHGLAFDERLVIDGNYSYNVAAEKAAEILDTGATAAFCLNDVMAHGLIRGAKSLGRRVPEDISVLGFDDIIFKNFNSFIELTTVRQPLVDMGRFLAESVITQVETGQCAGLRIFPTQIVEKQTVLPRQTK